MIFLWRITHVCDCLLLFWQGLVCRKGDISTYLLLPHTQWSQPFAIEISMYLCVYVHHTWATYTHPPTQWMQPFTIEISICLYDSWHISDGSEISLGTPTCYFTKLLPKNCMEMKEFGGVIPGTPPWICHCLHNWQFWSRTFFWHFDIWLFT